MMLLLKSKSVYGYSIDTPELYISIIKKKKINIVGDINKEDIYKINGVVPNLYSACIEAFSEIDDEVIVQTPIYPTNFLNV